MLKKLVNTNTTPPLKTVSTPGTVIEKAGSTATANAAAQLGVPVFKPLTLLTLTYLSTTLSYASDHDDIFRYRWYAGGHIGYGSTTWEGLVPSAAKQNIAINMSTPISITEGGLIGGALMGYEFTPYFGFEASYTQYPNARLHFDETSLFAFDHNDQTDLITQTEMVAVIAKIMLIIPHTHVRAYSDFGIADVHRDDHIRDQWKLTPTFGMGLNYNITPRIMTEIAATYAAGYGESEISPVDDYIPFLYAISFKLAYRIA